MLYCAKHNHNNTRGLGACPQEKILKTDALHEIEFSGISETQLYVAIIYTALIAINYSN